MLMRRRDAVAAELQRILAQWDAEAVHDLRVACRRMRSALRVFGPLYEPGATRQLDRGLRRFMRKFNGLRDLDVQLENWVELADGAPRGLHADLHRIHRAMTAEKAQLDRELRQVITAEPPPLELPPRVGPRGSAAGALARLPFASAAGRLLDGEVRECAARARAIDWRDPVASIAPLHAWRIQVKRLRYGIEHCSEQLGKLAKPLLTSLKSLQDALGHTHDDDVFAEQVIGRLKAQEKARYRGVRDAIAGLRWPDPDARAVYALAHRDEVDDTAALLFLLQRLTERRAIHAARVRVLQMTWLSTANLTGLRQWFASGNCPVVWRRLLADELTGSSSR